MKTLILVLLLFIPKAEALTIEWSGTCLVNCEGTAHATFTLKDDYVPGTDFLCDYGRLDCPIPVPLTLKTSPK
jgi:hypothetical protein